MKIIGHTPKGDLIIQVTQSEWERLQLGKPIVTAPIARDVLSKEWHALEKVEESESLKRAIGNVLHRGGIDSWLFDDFIRELYKPDSILLDIHGIGPKFLDVLRKHFSKYQLEEKP